MKQSTASNPRHDAESKKQEKRSIYGCFLQKAFQNFWGRYVG
jgi:hypothetical protein